jgi:hypothetical protein
MKRIDTRNMILVHHGQEWAHADAPCCKHTIHHLERNEPLVYWLQPVHASIEEQIPALKLKDGDFYSLSLRMMKALWRHVRLSKDFHNVERSMFGGYKLKIPYVLLNEKIRTQARFHVCEIFLKTCTQMYICTYKYITAY